MHTRSEEERVTWLYRCLLDAEARYRKKRNRADWFKAFRIRDILAEYGERPAHTLLTREALQAPQAP